MTFLIISAMLLVVFSDCAADQALQEANQPDPESYNISVNVDLVVLHATVRDSNGHAASGLLQQNFEVYEDGVRHPIRLFLQEDIPITVGLVVDHSGSMGRKLGQVIAAARTFVRSSNPEDQVFVVNFNENVTLGLTGANRFTNNLDELESALLRTPIAGKTALYDAIFHALANLEKGSRDKKVLIVISDGGDNASTVKLRDVLRRAAESGALLYTIGIFNEEDPDRNPGVLRRLARTTGGEAFMPGEYGNVVEICERIARDLRAQYTIGYVPASPAKPGVYRSVRLVAGSGEHGKLTVRTRSGYIAGGARTVPDKAVK